MKTEIQGKMEIQWFQINLGANLIGATCITGAILGLVGGTTNQNKFSGIGGIFTIFAPFIFLSCLPRRDAHIFLGLGGILTALGGVLMFFSVILEVHARDVLNSIAFIARARVYFYLVIIIYCLYLLLSIVSECTQTVIIQLVKY